MSRHVVDDCVTGVRPGAWCGASPDASTDQGGGPRATVLLMESAGIRELKQNASAVVAEAAAGEIVVITDRGRPVAQISPLSDSPYERMRAAGLIRAATRRLADLPAPEEGEPVSPVLEQMRQSERY